MTRQFQDLPDKDLAIILNLEFLLREVNLRKCGISMKQICQNMERNQKLH